MAINIHISDLFFNRDLDDCKERDGKEFVGYDNDALRAEADMLLLSLAGLGLGDLPDADEIVKDFLDRV